MPEGPELHLASRFINTVCKGRIFSGKVKKSEITKCPPVTWEADAYKISAVSRGKEIKLTLTEIPNDPSDETKNKQSTDIVFRFGLVGRFRFDPVEEIQKHAHLNFYTSDGQMVLSFVDYMRFGKWDPSGKWGADRGPCVLFEYDAFREKVLKNLKQAVFNKPICEALLDQRYFNGIGNYLRAEILHRVGIPPFVKARDVLENLTKNETVTDEKPVKTESKEPDILQLCHDLCDEVINLSERSGYDADDDTEESSAFSRWLRCYYNPTMKNMVDHNKRTIWFSGPPGPMAPSNAQTRHTGTKAKKKTSKKAFVSNVKEEDLKPDLKTEPAHMSDDHDYTNPKPSQKRQKSKTKDEPPLRRSSRSKSKDEAEIEEVPKTSKRKTRQKEQEDSLDTDAKVNRKRTNAHDWPTSPKKLRSRTRADREAKNGTKK